MPVKKCDSAIFKLNKVLTCGDIKLSTWCQNGRSQLLALYLSRGEFIFCLLTNNQPIVRRVPWYKDQIHRPVAIALSPAGSFLVVLSESCHLYTVPALIILDPTFKPDMALNSTDVTLYTYPFKISLNHGSHSSSQSSLEIILKLKELPSQRCDKIGSAVAWYQTLQDCQQVAVIGTKCGELIFVDLITGVKIASTFVYREITQLAVCQDNSFDSIFLLISTVKKPYRHQYRMTLEQRTNYNSSSPGKGRSSEDSEEEQPRSYRGRLHGFKQMSVEKLASIKMKIAETRAKAQLKPVPDEGVKSYLTATPEPINGPFKDTIVTSQYSRGRYVLSSFHHPSQMLMVFTSLAETNPSFVHKMPPETLECLLSDRVVYVLNKDRTKVTAVSSHISESRIEGEPDFDPDCILGVFNICHTSTPSNEEDEKIIGIYKDCNVVAKVSLPDEWKVDGLEKLLGESGSIECCIIVTTQRVLRVDLTNHIVCTALHLILEGNALMQAERLCKIFRLNLSKVLELAGDIDMTRLRFAAAIARFKLASCGPLRITVKLAKLGHCSELLSYCTALLTTATANLSANDNVHISNLLVMAFVHQILKGGSAHLRRKLLLLLETNDYFDKILCINVAAQPMLMFAVHKLISSRGLIVNGLSAISNIINKLEDSANIRAAVMDEDFWLCLSESSLQEAFVYRPDFYLNLSIFIAKHIRELPISILDRLCRMLDPMLPYLRQLTRLSSLTSSDEISFPLGNLVQLFLNILLYRLSKSSLEYDKNLMLPNIEICDNDVGYDIDRSNVSFDINSETDDNRIWAIRKERKDSVMDKNNGECLSCGFGHVALIRNGAVITWGMNHRGCLGHGPALARHNTPEPIPWFTCYRLQVSHVSCGRAHTVALTNNGVYAWGSSQFGQLGLGTIQECPHPRSITSLTGERVMSAVCGQYHTLFLTSNGSLMACGWNVHGQLGLGTIENVYQPVIVHTLKEHVIVEAAGGHGHSVVLTETGQVYTFGCSAFGQLGHGYQQKTSLPLLVKGIHGKVIKIATGYFHNLALTVSNTLFVWGASPQVLRLQGQAHKRARAMHAAPSGSEQQSLDIANSETHLKPVMVDTRNVSGKITKIACGCHHFALVTESGCLYTWGRSMDGQLGNGARNEVVVPSLIQDGSLRVSTVALGCDYSIAVEKNTSKVYAWGSNGYGQIGVAVKDTAGKLVDGKVIIVKCSKRTVRLPHPVNNVVDSPIEVSAIPTATFTYQSLSSNASVAPVNLSNNYNAAVWHNTLHKFMSVINPELLLCSCLEFVNHQAASKILILQGQTRQALVHQLKALLRAQKDRQRSQEKEKKSIEKRKKVQTPDAEIHPFTVEGGVEGMCDMVENPAINGIEESPPTSLDLLELEYSNTAQEIMLRYLLYAPESAADILETGLQFWTAQNLPMKALEAFLTEHMERVFYPLGTLLYLGKRDLACHFSAELQLRVTSRLVTHVEQNGNCGEFLAVLSTLLSLDGKPSVADLSAKLQNPPKKNIHVTWPKYPGDAIYVFSCGHTKTRIVVPTEQTKLAEAYSLLESEGTVDMACPDCVCSLLSTQVA